MKIAGDFSGKRVLDFGCGKGDFLGFIREKDIFIEYCGIDINENLIKLAKKNYPGAEFIAVDIDENEFNREFDIVFICGAFNLRVAGIEESMKGILKKLFKLCREVLYINLLTYYIPQRDIELFYVKPEEILQFVIAELSQSVSLVHTKEDIFLSIYK
jgi:SAM-dependent methyltransferase